MFWLLTLFCVFFIFITWTRFHLGLCLLFFLLPTYLIRFSIGSLPTTLLETMIGIIIIVWLIKYHGQIIDKIRNKISQNYNYTLIFAITLFLIAATISVFTSTNLQAAAGEWKAFYLEPILLFLILITTIENQKQLKHIIFALVLSGLLTAILAIYQHFTGWMVPWDFWENRQTFRVTAWYGFPNAVGLFLAPLIPLAIYLMKEYWNNIINFKIQDTNKLKICFLVISCLLFIVSSILAIIFSKGTGPLIGLVAGMGILLLFYKKTRWPTLIVSLVGLFILFNLSGLSSIKQELLLQDRSGQIRLSIYQETWQFLTDHPLTGAGLASYSEKIIPYHTTINGEGIEIFHHPHNIFLTMWVNLGILGLISFLWILIWFFKVGLINLNKQTKILLITMIVIIVMGLVDSPYIKNDLAMLFWLLPALMIVFLKNDKFI